MAAVLSLTTLQTAAFSTGLPLAVVLLLIVYALYVGFSQDFMWKMPLNAD